MATEVAKVYVFEEFRIDPEKRTLIRNGQQARLASRPFRVLLYLIENRERIITRSELLEKFWNGHDVYDEALTKAVGSIRKALGETTEKPRFIETRWAEGYRFTGHIEAEPVYEMPFIEIEKTREIKIAVEETKEGVDDIIPSRPKQISEIPFQPFFRRKTAVIIAGFFFTFLLVASLFVALRPGSRLSHEPSTTRFNSIAVLPIKNLRINGEGDAFADGMTESLISSLSRIGGIKVISRNSVFAFKNKETDPREIGKRLGVEAILEGSVRENNQRIRVEVRLVNTADGQILWSSDNYDRTFGDIFEIQDDIARSVSTRLRLRVGENDEKRLVKRQTNNTEAYRAYVKGRYFWNKKDEINMPKALEFFSEAIRLDPNYALAYAGLADYYATGIWYVPLAPKEATEKAKAAAEKALQLDPNLSDAHIVLALAAGLEWDWETMRKELERAIELDPNNSHAFHTYAFYLRNCAGRYDDAVDAMKKALELDPLSVSRNSDLGVMLNHAGRYEEAIEAFRKTLELEPYNDAYYNLGVSYERQGMFAAAVESYLTAWRMVEQRENNFEDFKLAFEKEGIRGFWRKHLEFLQRSRKGDHKPRIDSPFFIAENYARIGENDAAIESLEKSFAAREPYLVNLKSSFAFETLRSDARFSDLIRRLGL